MKMSRSYEAARIEKEEGFKQFLQESDNQALLELSNGELGSFAKNDLRERAEHVLKLEYYLLKERAKSSLVSELVST